MMNATTEPVSGGGLPVIRLSLLLPFAVELDRRGVDIEAVLRKHDLSRENLNSPEVFVTAPVMYTVLEGLASAAEDPYLAFYIGETLDLYRWPVFTDAARQSSTFGEFFIRFSREAGNQATSVKMRLETDGEHAVFRAYRVSNPDMCPAQADAFYVGLFNTIFQRCLGDEWDSSKVQVVTCDTGAIPRHHIKMMVAQGDRRGCSIRFPQDWLLLPFNVEDFKHRALPEVDYAAPPKSLIESVRQTLRPHMHKAGLDSEQAAEICGYSQRALARKLKAKGTTLNREISKLKEEMAIRALVETNKSIADIAGSVGFGDATVFSRSFKKWTGLSPREYRKHSRHGI